MKRSMYTFTALAALLLMGAAAQAADFAIGFDGCPNRQSGNPGQVVTFDVFATLTTSNNTEADGAQGWSLSIGVSGGTIDLASLTGVTVTTIYDRLIPDTDPPQSEHLDPYVQTLNNVDMFTKIAAKAFDPADTNKKGAISAIVMKGTEKQVLQPNGVEKVLKLTVSGTIPEEGCTDLVLSYVDGYIDFTGRIKAYAVVDLRVLGNYDWRLAETNIWKAERLLLEWPHRRIASSDRRAERLRRRYRAFREAHGYKPWKYYGGRDRWTGLPPEFRRRG